jgi:hypothetical protein
VGLDKRVDTAEMLRAFGEPVAQPKSGTDGPSGTSENQPVAHALAVENARLKAENEALRELVQRSDAERDRAIETMRLLTHDGAQRRRWWMFGR